MTEGEGRVAEEVDSRVRRLRRVIAALAKATSADEVAVITVEAGLVEAGSVSGGVWLPDGRELVALQALWSTEEQRVRLARVPIDADLPAPEVFRTGEPVWVNDPESSVARYPALGPTKSGYFALPLTGTDRVLGVFAGTFTAGTTPSAEDQTFLMTMADLCAQAFERTLAYDEERGARKTLEFLAQATEMMISAMEPAEVLRSLVRLAVPRLAPWCAVYVADAKGLRRAAVETTATVDISLEMPSTEWVPFDGETPVSRVFRTGKPETVGVDEPFVRALYADHPADTILTLGLTTALVVPIRLRGEVLGVLSLASPAPLDGEDLHFATTGLAARAAVALENARRHRHQEDVVRTLTEALLPSRLPEVEGYDLAARYVPASGGVCGDWYEADRTPEGALFFGLGDASGHGIGAASTMALVRNAALGLRQIQPEPERLLATLSDLVDRARPDHIVTALYGLLDPPTGELRWSSAGHPHGLVASAEGAVRSLPGRHGPALGVRSGQPANRHQLAPGDTLILYSDGVIERRGEHLDVGLQGLVDLIAAHAGAGPEELGDRIVDRLCTAPEDDCCLLIIRRNGPGA